MSLFAQTTKIGGQDVKVLPSDVLGLNAFIQSIISTSTIGGGTASVDGISIGGNGSTSTPLYVINYNNLTTKSYFSASSPICYSDGVISVCSDYEIPTTSQVASWLTSTSPISTSQISGLATVGTSGNYNDLLNLPNLAQYASTSALLSYLTTTGTAANSLQLGGNSSSWYASTSWVNSNYLGTSTLIPSTSGLASTSYVASNYLSTSGTAANSLELNGNASSYYASTASIPSTAGLQSTSQLGVANGYCPLNSSTQVATTYIPSLPQYQSTSQLGVANGYCPLNSSTMVSTAYLPTIPSTSGLASTSYVASNYQSLGTTQTTTSFYSPVSTLTYNTSTTLNANLSGNGNPYFNTAIISNNGQYLYYNCGGTNSSLLNICRYTFGTPGVFSTLGSEVTFNSLTTTSGSGYRNIPLYIGVDGMHFAGLAGQSLGASGGYLFLETLESGHSYNLNAQLTMQTATSGFGLSDHNLNGMSMSTTGTYIYTVPSGSDVINEYTGTSAWNLSSFNSSATCSLSNGSFNSVTSITWDSTGTYLFAGDENSNIYVFETTTPWNICSGISLLSTISVSGQISGGNIGNLSYYQNGNMFYADNAILTAGNVYIYAYNANANMGTAVFSQPYQSTTNKEVLIYLNNLLMGGVNYTFPTAFTYTPTVLTSPVSTSVNSVSTSGVVITTTSAQTGFIKLIGY